MTVHIQVHAMLVLAALSQEKYIIVAVYNSTASGSD